MARPDLARKKHEPRDVLSFPPLSQRVLHGWDLIGLSLAIFDVLRIDGMDAMCLPYAERRA